MRGHSLIHNTVDQPESWRIRSHCSEIASGPAWNQVRARRGRLELAAQSRVVRLADDVRDPALVHPRGDGQLGGAQPELQRRHVPPQHVRRAGYPAADALICRPAAFMSKRG